ncbi:MOSC domain-containing protein [Neptuniibacter sp. QD57_21]|uniref:MOSC domain-containing protein n=1 Tax=Neptuniibacter sp. QD57_21 TaxID=3398213 RepID=UPI0039F498B3
MSTYQGTIKGLYIGQPKPIGPDDAPSGIFKEPVEACLLTKTGLEGDVQVDKRVHGGPEKALYQFPSENYATLRQALPHLEDSFIYGSIGENLSSESVDDTQVHIGDIVKVGGALVQVSQPRRPCWKVNHKYGNGHIAPLLMSQAISGWYYRVLEEGELRVGDTFSLQERLEDSVAVAEVWKVFLEKLQSRLPPEAFNTNIPGLSTEWRFE